MWQNIIITLVSAAATALGSWLVAKVSSWITTKVKNSKLQGFLTAALNVVQGTVKATYQTYVEAIKGTDAWTVEAQHEALQMALDAAKAQLSQEIKDYIEDTSGDIDKWLNTQIEATIYTLKNTGDL